MLKSLNGIKLVRFEPGLHSQILYHWYYSGDYPEFYRNFPTCPNLQEIAAASSGKAFIITNEMDGSPLGVIMHFGEQEASRNFEVGILIDLHFQRQKIAITALKILLNWKFNDCNLYKVKIKCVASNKRLAKAVENFGAQFEGVLKKDTYFDGAYHDITAYAMFKHDFNLKYKLEFQPSESLVAAPISKEVENGERIARAV